MNLKILISIFLAFIKVCESRNSECDNLKSKYERFEINSSTNQVEFYCEREPERVTVLETLKPFSLKQYPDELIDLFTNLKYILLTTKDKTLEEFNGDFFIRENYPKIASLEISYAYRETAKNVEIADFEFLKKFQNLEFLSIREFNFDTFKEIKYGNKIKVLRLRENHIKRIRSDQLKNLVNLEELEITTNQIEILCEDYFSSNKKLKTVSFNENKIEKIPSGLFYELFDLKIVDFSQNKLKFLPKNLFRDNKKLREAYFFNNQIQKLDPELFTGITLQIKSFRNNHCIGAGDDYNSDLKDCYDNWRSNPPTEEETKTGKLLFCCKY